MRRLPTTGEGGALTWRFGTGDAILRSPSLLVVELIEAWQREE